jgi:hypothetical protein
MAKPEDALKAVEMLCEIVECMIVYPNRSVREDLEDLRHGCEDIRNGCRESKNAEKILVKPLSRTH